MRFETKRSHSSLPIKNSAICTDLEFSAMASDGRNACPIRRQSYTGSYTTLAFSWTFIKSDLPLEYSFR